MYTKMLVPLDGSKTAEKVLPHARYLAAKLKIPIELLAVIDIAELAAHIPAIKARSFDTLIEEDVRSSEQYLRSVAASFRDATVICTVEKGRPHETIIKKGDSDPAMLITMATHGRSGLNRFLLGSVTEKVLRGAANPLLLVRATEEAKFDGEIGFNTILVPLDGSELAETILPMAAGVAKKMDSELVVVRAYQFPYNTYAADDGYYTAKYYDLISAVREESKDYLENKVAQLKKLGLEKVSSLAQEGYAADEIISMGRKIPNSLIAMCSHGRSGVRRWVLGSVTENVVRHTINPVLVMRAADLARA